MAWHLICLSQRTNLSHIEVNLRFAPIYYLLHLEVILFPVLCHSLTYGLIALSQAPPFSYLNHIFLSSVATGFTNFLFCHSIICLLFHIHLHYCEFISQLILLYQLDFLFVLQLHPSSSLTFQVLLLDLSLKERMKMLRLPPRNCYINHPCCCLFWTGRALLARVFFPLVLAVTIFHKKLNVCSCRQ